MIAFLTGIKTNSRFLYCTEFVVIMDHLPLVLLFKNPTIPAPVQVERHRSKLRSFQFKVKYEPGRLLPCDYSSRHPPPPRSYSQLEKEELEIEEEEEDSTIKVGRLIMTGQKVNRVDNEPTVPAMTPEQFQKAMTENVMMGKLVKAVQTGQGRGDRLKTVYRQVLDELSYVGSMLERGDRVVVPDNL